ncbi:MAG: MerR family transcriptional regulator [Thermoanaerobaculia bacterium]|nr:MAG: MerR family transcriptional regulator [Thermoanaerobaculia bacterium]
MISVVAETYQVHPQTLRLYERQGLIRPARSAGNTRLYDEEAIRRLEAILTLTRDLGVNLAGVEVILNLREQVGELESRLKSLDEELRQLDRDRRQGVERSSALVPLSTRALVRR